MISTFICFIWRKLYLLNSSRKMLLNIGLYWSAIFDNKYSNMFWKLSFFDFLLICLSSVNHFMFQFFFIIRDLYIRWFKTYIPLSYCFLRLWKEHELGISYLFFVLLAIMRIVGNVPKSKRIFPVFIIMTNTFTKALGNVLSFGNKDLPNSIFCINCDIS